MSPTEGGVTSKVLTGRTANVLQRYRDSLKAGQEPALFSATRNCSHDVETQIAEWKAVRVEHGTQGAKRKVNDSYEAVDPGTGIHPNGQRGTHVEYFNGKRNKKRPVRAGETPTHLCVKADALVADVKQSEAVHTIYAAARDLVNPDSIEDCARFFLAVKTMRDEKYPGIQESMWLERNGESGLVHVHVASNATIYEDFDLGGVQYTAGNKMAMELTKVDSVRATFEQFLDAHPEYELKQSLARVGTEEYKAAQRRDGQHSYWEAKRGKETQQDQIRRKVYETLIADGVEDQDSFVAKMDELGVEVSQTGLRRGVPGKNHDFMYRLHNAKQRVKGKTLGVDYSYNAIDAQLSLKALGQEIEQPTTKQKAGAAKPLPFEQRPWDEATQRGWEKLNAEVEDLVENERQQQAAELVEMGPAAIGRSVVAGLERRRSAWSRRDLERALDRRLKPVAETDIGDLEQMHTDALATAQSKLVSVLDHEADNDRVRHWTTQDIIDQEQIIEASLEARTNRAGVDGKVKADRGSFTLADGQAAAAKSLTGTHRFSVIEGAAGSGKTTLLMAANEELIRQGRRMVVVSPTKKGAIEAGEAIDAEGNSVHSMLYRAGAYMDPADNNRWVLPEEWKEQPDPWHMDKGTVLVVDEVGMLDKSTAAVFHKYVDDMNVGTLAVMGDSKQLAAVGRGGYLSRAAELADKHTVLDEVQRFRTADGELDAVYATATLKLRMRQGPGDFVDLLQERDQLVTGKDEEIIRGVADNVVDDLAAGHDSMAISATNAMNQRINHAIFDRLAAEGAIDSRQVVEGRDGDRIAVGAKVATRKNNVDYDVANRETWMVEQVRDNGDITVTDHKGRRRDLAASYVREDVQLAWALTGHGAQGMTVDRSHVVLTDNTDAAGLYVSLTRGRHANTVHAVADSDLDARTQFVAATRRENADVGLAHARQVAEAQAEKRAQEQTQQARNRQTFVTKAPQKDQLDWYRQNYGPELDDSMTDLTAEFQKQYSDQDPAIAKKVAMTRATTTLEARVKNGTLEGHLRGIREERQVAAQESREQQYEAAAEAKLADLTEKYPAEMAELRKNGILGQARGREIDEETQAKFESKVHNRLRHEALTGSLVESLEYVRQTQPWARTSGFHSALRDREVKNPKTRAKLDRFADLEETYWDREPDAEFNQGLVDAGGVGSRVLKTYGQDMSEPFYKNLLAREVKQSDARSAWELNTKNQFAAWWVSDVRAEVGRGDYRKRDYELDSKDPAQQQKAAKHAAAQVEQMPEWRKKLIKGSQDRSDEVAKSRENDNDYEASK